MNSDVVAQIQKDVENITPFDELEKDHVSNVLAWIKSGTNIFRISKPDNPPKHLVSYFVVIDPQSRSILLGDHIKAQLWLPSGGHVEPNENPKNTVLREAKEELNMRAEFLHGKDTPFFVTVTQTVGLTAGHTDVSLWYALQGNVHESFDFDRAEFTSLKWFTFEEILQSKSSVFDPHMQRFTQKLQQSSLMQVEQG